jgi:hypothetical protein
MNAELHHKWNGERDPNRGSHREGRQVKQEERDQHKVTLRQNKPR